MCHALSRQLYMCSPVWFVWILRCCSWAFLPPVPPAHLAPSFFGLWALVTFSDLELHLFCCPISSHIFSQVPFSHSPLWAPYFLLNDGCSFYFSPLFFPLVFYFPHFSTSLVLLSPGSKLLFLKSPAFLSFCPHSMFIPLPFTWHWFPCVANLAMDLKGLKSEWSSAHPWEAWHLTPPCVQGRITEGLVSPSADSEEGAFIVSMRNFLLNKPALSQTRKALCERFMSRM